MPTGFMMQFDLSLLKSPLPGVESSLGQGFDGVGDVRVDVDGCVHHAVCSDAQNRGQLQPAG